MNENEEADEETSEDCGEGIRVGDDPLPVTTKKVGLPVIAGLRPKQVQAAIMLVEGRTGAVELPYPFSWWRGPL